MSEEPDTDVWDFVFWAVKAGYVTDVWPFVEWARQVQDLAQQHGQSKVRRKRAAS